MRDVFTGRAPTFVAQNHIVSSEKNTGQCVTSSMIAVHARIAAIRVVRVKLIFRQATGDEPDGESITSPHWTRVLQ